MYTEESVRILTWSFRVPPSRRNELIDAAMRVFSRKGFHTSNLDDILEEGGISRMTLYNHFKSKDELIIAAMQRKDELFNQQLQAYLDSRKASSPQERILAIFDYFEQWFSSPEFSGCLFINVSAEFFDADCEQRRLAATHKQELVRTLRTLCEQGGFEHPEEVAQQLQILFEGAIVAARVVGQVEDEGRHVAEPARTAKAMASMVLERSPRRAPTHS
jgi:AcrR family transcriptional regulator